MINLSDKDIARFWYHVDVRTTEKCWTWKITRDKDGYGRFTYHPPNKNQVTLRAHRVAWELINGDIPENTLVCHSCDNPSFCNPSHLWLGKYVDNERDKIQKGRDYIRGIKVRHIEADKEYSSITEAARKLKMSESSIRECLRIPEKKISGRSFEKIEGE